MVMGCSALIALFVPARFVVSASFGVQRACSAEDVAADVHGPWPFLAAAAPVFPLALLPFFPWCADCQ